VRNERSKISENVRCVYEVIVSGLRLEYVNRAMKGGIESATKVHGVLKITAANYGGTLGKGKILLQNLFDTKS
jgi:formylmethanofuran--tetrahydromethanopterin N-formyltransferase